MKCSCDRLNEAFYILKRMGYEHMGLFCPEHEKIILSPEDKPNNPLYVNYMEETK